MGNTPWTEEEKDAFQDFMESWANEYLCRLDAEEDDEE